MESELPPSRMILFLFPGVVTRAIRRQYLLVAGVVAAGMASVHIHLSQLAPVYVATAQFRYVASAKEEPLDRVLSRVLGAEATSGLQDQIRIVTSQPVIERALSSKGIEVLEEGTSEEEKDERVRQFQSLVEAAQVPNTNLIEVRVSGPDRGKAKEFANALVGAFKEHDLLEKKRHSIELRSFLTRDLDELRTKLVLYKEILGLARSIAAEEGETAGLKKEIPGLEAEMKRILDKWDGDMVELNEKYTTTHPKVRALQTRIDKAKELALDPRTVGDSLVEELGLGEFKKTVVRMREIEKRTDELELNLKKERPLRDEKLARRRVLESAAGDRRSADEREAGIEPRSPDSETPSAPEELSLDILEKEIQALESQYSTFATELARVELAMADQTSGVQDVTGATASDVPRNALGPSFYAFGFAISFVLGTALALLVESRRRALESAQEAEEALRVPVLAELPRTRTALRSRGPVLATEDGPVRDAFRLLKFSIENQLAGASRVAVAVTAPEGGDGTTSVAAGLAFAFSSLGKETLLVDAHTSPHELARALGAQSVRTWGEVLRQESPLEEAVSASAHPGLSVLSARTDGGEIAELSLERAAALAQALRNRYPVVLFDTPPPTAAPEALVFGRSTDGMLLVCRAGGTRRSAAIRAVRVLGANGLRVIGVVLNHFEKSLEP